MQGQLVKEIGNLGPVYLSFQEESECCQSFLSSCEESAGFSVAMFEGESVLPKGGSLATSSFEKGPL